MDIRLSELTHDLEIVNGDLVLADGIDAVGQHLKIRLWLFQGELVFRTDYGIPYYENVLVKNPDTLLIESVFRNAVLATPGILSLEGFDLEFDTSTRRLALEFQATGDAGPINFSEVL